MMESQTSLFDIEPLPFDTPPTSFTIEEAIWLAQTLLDEAVESRITDISSSVWNHGFSEDTHSTCQVCLLNPISTRKLHSSCAGRMCRGCVGLWFSSKNTCPFCRICLENQ